MCRQISIDALGPARASLDRFFAKGFGSSRTPQRLSLFTPENLIAWLASDGFAITSIEETKSHVGTEHT